MDNYRRFDWKNRRLLLDTRLTRSDFVRVTRRLGDGTVKGVPLGFPASVK